MTSCFLSLISKLQGNDDRKSVPLRKLTDSKSMPPYLLWDHRGRLGNNIFEYASSYCIAIHSNHIPTISNDSRLLNLFKGIKAVKISRKFRRQNLTDATTVHEKGYAIHNSNLTTEIRYISSPVRTDGYLQSHKYFSKCNTDIKQQFTFVDDLQDDVHQIMVTIVLKHLLEQNYISIHDMDSFLENKTVPQEITYIGVHCRSKLVFDIDYLPRAMNYFRKKYKNVLFLLCTDTPTWVQSFLQNQLQHNDAISVSVETSTYKEDFGILVNCNHSLITGILVKPCGCNIRLFFTFPTNWH